MSSVAVWSSYLGVQIVGFKPGLAINCVTSQKFLKLSVPQLPCLYCGA